MTNVLRTRRGINYKSPGARVLPVPLACFWQILVILRFESSLSSLPWRSPPLHLSSTQPPPPLAMRFNLARRRFRWSALAVVFLFALLFLTLSPQSMNSSLKRLSQLRAHLLSVPTPLSQPRALLTVTRLSPSTPQETAKIGALLSTTQARPLSTSEMSDYKIEVDEAIKANHVMVFSKSYCPVRPRLPRLYRRTLAYRPTHHSTHSTARKPRSSWRRKPSLFPLTRSTRSSSA